ncbi:pyridoxal phosphate-dependent aminotransferase [Flavobacterium poyangense]|uniref:pyridoxal phosphate-dependent aminotransferase n=1 Tax=Flavobacterium poyangense TaxID=2204302 RepID=UPI0014248FD7|nr:aminotransferase class I/II-fold pyridoxal phosphate-dependent enzyme [Flavobacterium sp. JXAS1]
MEKNRRDWLKKIGVGVVGLGLVPYETFALPINSFPEKDTKNTLVRLSSNENPYGPSKAAKDAMMESITLSNRYGWDITAELVNLLGVKNNVPQNHILVSAGSTEILDLVARFAALQKGNLVIPDPTFGYWADTAEKLGLTKIKVPLTADKKIDLPRMLTSINSDTKLVYICNPNNPTGTICERNDLVQFITQASKNSIVLVDEAYIDYTDQKSVSDLVLDNKNLIIVKTFSKVYGLAGARIGYAIANSSTIEKLTGLQTLTNGDVSVVSAAGAIAAIKDENFVNTTKTLNQKTREYTIRELEKLHIPCIPSAANFVYFSLKNYKKDFFHQLKTNTIIGTKIYEQEGKWSRITIGKMEEMQKFIASLQ